MGKTKVNNPQSASRKRKRWGWLYEFGDLVQMYKNTNMATGMETVIGMPDLIDWLITVIDVFIHSIIQSFTWFWESWSFKHPTATLPGYVPFDRHESAREFLHIESPYAFKASRSSMWKCRRTELRPTTSSFYKVLTALSLLPTLRYEHAPRFALLRVQWSRCQVINLEATWVRVCASG